MLKRSYGKQKKSIILYLWIVNPQLINQENLYILVLVIWFFFSHQSETEFQITEYENFKNQSELLSRENEKCYIGSVKQEYSCLRRDCLKRLRCIWNNKQGNRSEISYYNCYLINGWELVHNSCFFLKTGKKLLNNGWKQQFTFSWDSTACFHLFRFYIQFIGPQ